MNQQQRFETGAQPSLKAMLMSRGLTVLVPPHHGLESCYSPDLYAAINGAHKGLPHQPHLVCISERRKAHENDGNTDSRYQGKDGSIGVQAVVNSKTEFCNSITTKQGLHILIIFSGLGSWWVYADIDPHALLQVIKTTRSDAPSNKWRSSGWLPRNV